MNKQQAYLLLKADNSTAVRSLAAGEREILLAKIALDAGHTDEAIRLLSSAATKKNPLAAMIRAEAYRRQSVAAAKRAGHYAHAVTGDIGKLQNARLNVALAEAESRLQTFMVGHAVSHIVSPTVSQTVNQPVSQPVSIPATRPVAVAAIAHPGMPGSVRQMINTWRKDWESRDANRYLSHYHPNFRTKKHDFASWSKYKRRVNSRKKYIKVQLSGLRIRRGSESIAEGEAILITFRQRYQSSNYAANSRKQLYLVRRHSGEPWLILYEGDADHLYHRPVAKAKHHISRHSNRVRTAKPRAWAINIGSFDAATNAEHMVSDIHLNGSQQAFVSSVSAHGKTVHRVRIGFYIDRHAAVEAMIKLCPELGLSDCWLEQLKQ